MPQVPSQAQKTVEAQIIFIFIFSILKPQSANVQLISESINAHTISSDQVNDIINQSLVMFQS